LWMITNPHNIPQNWKQNHGNATIIFINQHLQNKTLWHIIIHLRVHNWCFMFSQVMNRFYFNTYYAYFVLLTLVFFYAWWDYIWSYRNFVY
jgi:hypothetical protein